LRLKLPAAFPSPVSNSAIEPVVGAIDVSGNLKLKSNSLLQLNNLNQGTNSYSESLLNNVNLQGIKIYKDDVLKNVFNSSSIKSLKLIGDYNVIITSRKGTLPYMKSNYDYFGVLLPKFNMTINMSNKSLTSAEIILRDQKNQTVDKIKVNRSSTIEFQNIQSGMPDKGSFSKSRSPVAILLKSPEIEVDGKTKFATLRYWWNYLDKATFDKSGLKTKLNYVDDYTRPYGKGTVTDYVSFVNNTVSH